MTDLPSNNDGAGNKADDTAEDDLDLDVNMEPAPAEAAASENAEEEEEGLPEAREPTKKDISLRDFLSKMDEYAPIVCNIGQEVVARKANVCQIPDAVTAHHLLLAGLDPSTTPLPLTRLLALATQKFIADVAADAYQYSRMRSSNSTAAATAAAGPGPGGLGELPGQAGSGGAGGGSKGKDDKSKSGAHVLGVQRAGYGGGGGGGGAAGQGGRAVLTMEDLGCAVGEYGVNVKRGEFYR